MSVRAGLARLAMSQGWPGNFTAWAVAACAAFALLVASVAAADVDFDYLFSVRAEPKTHADGHFIYHGYVFNLIVKRAACVSWV